MKNSSIKKTNSFFTWFAKLGGEAHLIPIEQTTNKLSSPTFLVSTLKNRSRHVKENFNYKFQER